MNFHKQLLGKLKQNITYAPADDGGVDRLFAGFTELILSWAKTIGGFVAVLVSAIAAIYFLIKLMGLIKSYNSGGRGEDFWAKVGELIITGVVAVGSTGIWLYLFAFIGG